MEKEVIGSLAARACQSFFLSSLEILEIFVFI